MGVAEYMFAGALVAFGLLLTVMVGIFLGEMLAIKFDKELSVRDSMMWGMGTVAIALYVAHQIQQHASF
ncbi:hypothetical protein D1872_51090 [compost metagenome]